MAYGASRYLRPIVVQAPELERVHAELVGGVVHHAFEHIDGFWPPSAAIGIHLGRVGEEAFGAHIGGGHVIDGAAQRRRAEKLVESDLTGLRLRQKLGKLKNEPVFSLFYSV